jgi:hypothetical protein
LSATKDEGVDIVRALISIDSLKVENMADDWIFI